MKTPPPVAAAGHMVREGKRPGFDVDDDVSVRRALDAAEAAVWLVHGLRRGGDYPAWEVEVAQRFGVACRDAGVQRIVYLGGIEPRAASTKHLQARLATGRALAGGGVDVVELRAGVIIGAGGESWTMARDGAARLPLLLSPPWLGARQQPVALDDVVAALVRALSVPAGIYDVPGPEALSAREMLVRTARLLGRKPHFLPVPAFPRRLAGRVTPWIARTDRAVARELFTGAGLDLTVDGDGIFGAMPEHRRLSFDEAALKALAADDVSLAAGAWEALLRRLP